MLARPAAQPMPKGAPKLLPKGPNKLLITRNGKLSLLDPDGKNETVLSSYKEQIVQDARLSPDGKMVAVLLQADRSKEQKAKPNPKRALYVCESGSKELGAPLSTICQTFVWSADGTEIVWAEFESANQEIPKVAHVSYSLKTKEKLALKLPGGHIVTDWSRDGRFFLTTRIAKSEPSMSARLYLMNRDGTEHKALTDEKQLAVLGRLSPDGTRVLYTIVTPPENGKPGEPKHELAVLSVTTGESEKVQDQPLNGQIQEGYSRSPDGKKVVYSWRQRHDGKFADLQNKETETRLIVCDPDGKNAKTIVTEKGKGQWRVTLTGGDWR
ncbi:MAG TPA: hypothetical protein VGE74_08890 [Gemmata sp.]